MLRFILVSKKANKGCEVVFLPKLTLVFEKKWKLDCVGKVWKLVRVLQFSSLCNSILLLSFFVNEPAYSVHWTPVQVHFTPVHVHFTPLHVHFTPLHVHFTTCTCTLYTCTCTPNTVRCTLYTVHCALYRHALNEIHEAYKREIQRENERHLEDLKGNQPINYYSSVSI